MTLPVVFRQSSDWNTGSSGDVGGALSATGVGSSLGDVFPSAVSDFIGQPDNHRFQKVYVFNTGSVEIENLKVYFSDLELPSQIRLAIENASGDTGTSPSSLPSGYVTGDFSTPEGIVNAVAIPDTGLAAGTAVGVWLWQTIAPDLPTETGVVATLGVIGEV